MNVIEVRDNQRRAVIAVKDAKIGGLSKELAEIKDTQMSIEDKIYAISIENKKA